MIPIIKQNFEAEIRRVHEGEEVGVDGELMRQVAAIGAEIQQNHDRALLMFTRQFDRAEFSAGQLRVTEAEIKQAHTQVSGEFVAAFQRAITNIRWFHQHQRPNNWQGTTPDGVEMSFRHTAISSVGLYVPGGKAVYPSSVAMNAIPAIIAGVKRIVMVSPPRPDGTLAPEVLVAADLCGVTEIYKIGGAQAIFALALGTETIPKVDKIVGPGNKYVTQAKQQVFGLVAIDKPAGPSEVAVYLETESEARFAAAEMLAQLEHDPDSVAVAISPDKAVLESINKQFDELLKRCLRQDILEKSRRNTRLFYVKSTDEAVAVLNNLASEHVVIMGANPEAILDQVENGGAFFLGPYTPVTLGDYVAGTNHVLPTSGTARFSSPLGVADFLKNSSVVRYSKAQLDAVRSDISILTAVEGLDAHKLNVEVRFED